MFDDEQRTREPLVNLMRVVAFSPGVASHRTLTILFAVAKLDRHDRRFDEWGRLMLAIEAANKSAEHFPEHGYRRVSDPAARRQKRRKSGIQPQIPRRPRRRGGLEETG